MRNLTIRRLILETLQAGGNYAIPEATVRSHVNALVRPAIHDAEWAENVAWLFEQQAIDEITNPFDETLRQLHIKESGRVLLNQL